MKRKTNLYKRQSDSHLLKLPNPNDNFGLTKQEFDQFVDKVKRGDESLFLKVFNVHFKESVRYIQNKFNIPEEIAHDTCMDALLEFRTKLKSGKISYGNIRYLFTKMAVHRYLDDKKKNNKVREAIQIFIGAKISLSISEVDFLSMLNRAIDGLDEPQKHMIREIFYSGKEMEQIIKENDITYATYRKRKQRSIDKLKSTFLVLLKKHHLL
jgi:DNA-directed RNA polymerase specialized sigma24 family protein